MIKKIKCSLNVRGSDSANAAAEKDLEIPDPEKDKAIAIINEALGTKDDDEEETP